MFLNVTAVEEFKIRSAVRLVEPQCWGRVHSGDLTRIRQGYITILRQCSSEGSRRPIFTSSSVLILAILNRRN